MEMKVKWKKKFIEKGLRFTVPRKAILETLDELKTHPTAEEIFLNAHNKNPNIGLTTVYRTLDLLVNIGLVYQFHLGGKGARYELIRNSYNSGHHHHLICINCKQIFDFNEFTDDEVQFYKKIEKGLTKRYNFNISNHIINFYGICGPCQDK